MKFWSIRKRAFFITLATSAMLLALMDSCIQFRMSRGEIQEHLSKHRRTGTLEDYAWRKNKYIHYLHVGDTAKPLVIFVHGSPGSLSAFIDFMTDSILLSKAQLVSVDRPGFGDSNFGYAEKSLAEQAKALRPVIEKYKNRKPVFLVGHSMGGPVIVRMAMDYPELIDGLVIVAGSVDPELEPNETWFRAPLATPLLSWMVPRSMRASNYEIYHLKPELQDMLPLWPQVKCRVKIIQGTSDNLVPPGNAIFAKKMLSQAKSVDLTMREGMNHFVPWEHPELIRTAILELLDGN